MKQTLETAAEELGMSAVRIDSTKRDTVWNFISVNLDRLRPIGFDGHTVVCRKEDESEIAAL